MEIPNVYTAHREATKRLSQARKLSPSSPSNPAEVIFAAAGSMAAARQQQQQRHHSSNPQPSGKAHVKNHKDSIISQLARPTEVMAMLKLKLFHSQPHGAEKRAGVNTRLPAVLWDHLDRTSRSFAAVIKALPQDPSDTICMFYLLLRALDTVEDEMDLSKFRVFLPHVVEGVTAEELLQVKVRLCRDFYTILSSGEGEGEKGAGEAPIFYPVSTLMNCDIGSAGDRHLLDSLRVLVDAFHSGITNGLAKTAIRDVVREMGQGMGVFVGRDMSLGTRDEADFKEYCHIVAGLVGLGLTRIFAEAYGMEDASLCEGGQPLADSMGIFLQQCNIVRDVCEDAADGRSWWPQTVWRRERGGRAAPVSLGELRDLEVLDEMVRRALETFPHSLDYLSLLHDPHVFRFCAVPQVMALATLEACYHNPKVYTGVVKIRKGTAARIALAFFGGINEEEEECATLRLNALLLSREFLLSIRTKALAAGDGETARVAEGLLQCDHLRPTRYVVGGVIPDMFSNIDVDDLKLLLILIMGGVFAAFLASSSLTMA